MNFVIQNDFVWKIWLLAKMIFHIKVGTLICKFPAIPDWLDGESESGKIRLAAQKGFITSGPGHWQIIF